MDVSISEDDQRFDYTENLEKLELSKILELNESENEIVLTLEMTYVIINKLSF